MCMWCHVQDSHQRDCRQLVPMHCAGPVCVWYCAWCSTQDLYICVCGIMDFVQDQYVFIHDAILEAVTCGDTQIESSDLRAKLYQMQKNQSDKTELELQFTVSPLINTIHCTLFIHCIVRSWTR